MAIPLFDSLFKLVSTLINSVGGGMNGGSKRPQRSEKPFSRNCRGFTRSPADWPPGHRYSARLRKVFPALQSCFSTYRPFIPKSEQGTFDEAWLIYRTATKREIDTQSYTHYMDMTSVTLSSFGGGDRSPE